MIHGPPASSSLYLRAAPTALYLLTTVQGTFLSRSARALLHLAKRPALLPSWVLDRLLNRTPLERALPWISWPCIEFLEKLDLENRRVFEYGGGGSTLFFLNRGCQVCTVENSAAWADKISASAVEFASRLELRLVEMPEHPGAADGELAKQYIELVERGAPWDLVLVDGVDGNPSVRMACLEAARRCVPARGIVILDDSWRPEYERAPEIMSGFSQTILEGLGPARLGVTRTDIYIAR